MTNSRILVALAVGCLLVFAGAAHLARAQDAQEQGPAGDADRGRELYQLCSQCHGERGEGNEDFLAPAIARLDAWYVHAQLDKFRKGLRGTHHQDTGGLRMYPMSLTLRKDADIEDLAAYVSSMPPVEPERVLEDGNAEQGAQYYQLCATCHGPDGKGNQQLDAPPLANGSDWYLASSLAKFKAGIRGGDPRNNTAVIMRGMANSLPDEQAIRDVVAYIMTLE